MQINSVVEKILFIGNRELPHTPTLDKKMYRISRKATSSHFARYTVEVQLRTKDTNEGNSLGHRLVRQRSEVSGRLSTIQNFEYFVRSVYTSRARIVLHLTSRKSRDK